MTLVIPMWFVYLWAAVLVIGCVTNITFNRKFDKLSQVVADKAVARISQVIEQSIEKVDSKTKRCSNTSKRESPSQNSQKK